MVDELRAARLLSYNTALASKNHLILELRFYHMFMDWSSFWAPFSIFVHVFRISFSSIDFVIDLSSIWDGFVIEFS